MHRLTGADSEAGGDNKRKKIAKHVETPWKTDPIIKFIISIELIVKWPDACLARRSDSASSPIVAPTGPLSGGYWASRFDPNHPAQGPATALDIDSLIA
jgi:hypothetical protein